ncbi:MAG: hypothetical protein AB1427_10275 [Thermodesulfobacteriota bacterium]
MVASPGWAGTLSISSRTSLTVLADRIQVDVVAENRGSEPANRVQAHLYIFERRYSADAVDQLDVGRSRAFRFAVPLTPDLKGEFVFVGEIRYHDANYRPIAALSAETFKLGAAGDGLLSGSAPELTLTGNERLSVQIRSRDPESRDVFAALYLPPDLTTPQPQKRIRLKAFETADVDFPLAVRHRSGDATYPVLCALTYHDAGGVHSAVVRTVVHVKDFQNWFVVNRWYWLAAGGLIVLGWMGAGIADGGLRKK